MDQKKSNEIKNKNQKKIYLDSNSTTIMPTVVRDQMIKWMNKGNPSSSHESAVSSQKLINSFRYYLANVCKFQIKAPDALPTPANYTVIFTSGASESNSTIIRMVVESYITANNDRGHIIISAIEHKSILDTATQLAAAGMIELTQVQPDRLGFISTESVESAIQPNTCLICIIHGNNETGAINDIAAIGRMAHKRKIPIHFDVVQTFGKIPLNPIESSADSFSLSFHKLHGPMGVGALIIKDEFLSGYKLKAIIGGTQNYGLRGGTENIPGIAGSQLGLEYTLKDRTAKNSHLVSMKTKIIKSLAACGIPVRTLEEYIKTPNTKTEMEIIIVSPPTIRYLPNTLMLSVIKRTAPPICNVNLRKRLEEQNVIVSIGSACNTSSAKASHVVYAMQMDELLRVGILRISLPDGIEETAITEFVKIFAMLLRDIK